MHNMIQQQDENGKQHLPSSTTTLTAVAVDRDKSSQQAVKWTVDHLLVGNHTMILVHVRSKIVMNNGFSIAEATPMASKEQLETEMSHLFLPFRALCARRGVQLMEVVLEDVDVARAIVDYITANHIHNIVVGASSRSALSKKFRNTDVATTVSKTAPEFCAVYVISKGKPQSVRSARGPPPAASAMAAPPKQLPIVASSTIVNQDPDGSAKARTSNRGGLLPPPSPLHAAADRRSLERIDNMRPPQRERPLVPGTRVAPAAPLVDGVDAADSSHNRLTRRSWSHDSTDELDFGTSTGFQALDFGDTPEQFSSTPPSASAPESPKESLSPTSSSSSQRNMEAEMRRLKLELKQTMDMYSTACKEAISAKQKAKELQQWKMEEALKIAEARNKEEAALRIAEMEKARCKAALEAAEAARRIAELEAHKRKNAEMKAKRESEEKLKALDTLVRNDVQYRKYSIDDIEIATNYFSDSLKIGEGGYGPVYRASLDHTPVAIKVLRPDAAQGRKQFLQEVEVLSRIRHPNMVLLLGACPEYGCLVYEYMDNGSLEDRLFRRGNTPPIPWTLRFKIAAEIATGVLFLHQAKPEPLVHRDLKPANILLDRNYVSKVSDVGLARLVPPSVAENVTQYRMTSTAGTFCYIDPEYQQTGMLGVKSDVYSLGILLLQIITAKSPMGLTHHVDRAIERGTFKEMLDSSVKDWPVEEALSFAKIALKCAELKRRDRPDLATVVLPELNRLRNLSHAYEEGLAINSGFGGGAVNSVGVSNRTTNIYNNGEGHQRARSDVTGQETKSIPNVGTSWRAAEDV